MPTVTEPAPEAFVSLSSWESVLDGAVNKRFLSTGETGELVRVNVGFDLNLGVDRATPRNLSSNGRERVERKNCGMLGIRAERGKELLSTKRALEVGAETVWLLRQDSNLQPSVDRRKRLSHVGQAETEGTPPANPRKGLTPSLPANDKMSSLSRRLYA
jgi:hypothetical protein